jgi:hypothetical protein
MRREMKEMNDHLLACQRFLKESHELTRFKNEQASFLKIKDISFFEHLYCVSRTANSMDITAMQCGGYRA